MTQTNQDRLEQIKRIISIALQDADPVEGVDEAAAQINQLISDRIREAWKEGEKYGRSDELVRLSDWGKTIDDQWNNHFQTRLAELLDTTKKSPKALNGGPQKVTESICQICGDVNPVWFTDNAPWDQVINGEYHFVCPNCFIGLAEEVIKPTGWELIPEFADTTKPKEEE